MERPSFHIKKGFPLYLLKCKEHTDVGWAEQRKMLSLQRGQLWKVPAREGRLTGRKAAESLFGHPGQQDTAGLQQLSSGKPSQIAEGTQIRAAFLAHCPDLHRGRK